jgi:deazaflavin-dependent oxidoreductase (nitroreductase family)
MALNDEVTQALGKDRVIDMTTIGRTSGQPRRKETWFHNIDGKIYLTGTPGKRDWYANMVANPSFTFHLKESAQADLAAQARPVTEPEERRAVLARILVNVGRPASDLPAWEANSPLVEVTFDDA